MTDAQKKTISNMRENGSGYNEIAREMKLPLNTIKTFCRRNNLTGNRRGTQTENKPAKCSESGLISDENRGNTTRADQPGSLVNAVVPDDHPVCEVTVSYAEETDETAIADVLNLLMSAEYGR